MCIRDSTRRAHRPPRGHHGVAHIVLGKAGSDSLAHSERGGTGMTTQPNATEIRHFFEQLYPDIQDSWLVLSQPDSDPAHVHPNGKRWLRSEWLNLAQTSHARVAEIAATLSAQDTVYL